MRYFFSLPLVFLMIAFGCNSITHKTPNDEKVVNRIAQETAKKLKEKKNLILMETGRQMMHETEILAVSFNYYQGVNIDSARSLIIYAINEYLSDINNNKIKLHLSNYPLTSKNMEIKIFTHGPDRCKLPPENISYILSRDGILRYYMHADDAHPICKETYEEALCELACNQGLEVGVRNAAEKVIVAEAVAKDGAKIKINVSSFKYAMYQLSGEGFRPCEPLNCIYQSCDEVLYFQLKANKNGALSGIGLTPSVIGKSGGMCRVDILRDGCPLHIKYPWGTEALR